MTEPLKPRFNTPGKSVPEVYRPMLDESGNKINTPKHSYTDKPKTYEGFLHPAMTTGQSPPHYTVTAQPSLASPISHPSSHYVSRPLDQPSTNYADLLKTRPVTRNDIPTPVNAVSIQRQPLPEPRPLAQRASNNSIYEPIKQASHQQISHGSYSCERSGQLLSGGHIVLGSNRDSGYSIASVSQYQSHPVSSPSNYRSIEATGNYLSCHVANAPMQQSQDRSYNLPAQSIGLAPQPDYFKPTLPVHLSFQNNSIAQKRHSEISNALIIQSYQSLRVPNQIPSCFSLRKRRPNSNNLSDS